MEGEKRELYLANSFDELNKRITNGSEIKTGTMPSCATISNLIEKLWTSAKQAEHSRDEELAYVVYMRMFECLKLMRSCKDIHMNQSTLNHYMKGAEIWYEKATDLSASLKIRYDRILNAKLEEERKIQAEIDEEKSLNKSINPRLLYKYLNQKKKNILLIDMRLRADYNQSHLRASNCINIPADLMAGKGWTSWSVEAALNDEKTRSLFKNRGNYDYVVLFDFNSYEEDLVPNHPLSGLREAVSSLDREVQLKHEPMILQGGYLDWMDVYPGESTAPLAQQNNSDGLRPFERAYPEDVQQTETIPSSDFITVDEPSVDISPSISLPNIDRSRKPVPMQKPETPAIENEFKHNNEMSVTPVQPIVPDLTTKIQATTSVTPSIDPSSVPTRPTAPKPTESTSVNKVDLVIPAKSISNHQENPTSLPKTPNILPNRENLAIYRPFSSTVPIEESNNQYQKGFDRVTGRKIFLDTKTNRKISILPENNLNKTFAETNSIPTVNRDIKPVVTELVRRQIAIDYSAIPTPLQINRRTGLQNLGNSCYMNAVVQSLSFNLTLTNYFLTGEFSKSINVNNRLSSRGVIAREWFRLVYALWSEQYACISPQPFKRAVGSVQNVYLGTQQQDAHEFLVFLLDALHEDLNQTTRPQTEELKSENFLDDYKFAEATKANFYLHNRSKIIDLFYGLFKSTTICLTCSYPSNRFEPFAIISVPIPRVRQTTLDECLKLFHDHEHLSGNESYKCSKCKQVTDKKRGLEIWELPKLFIVHFKRFRPQQNYYIKSETLIRYKLSNVDFSRWSKTSNASKYSLVAVVNHYGSMNSGHYTAFCNDGKRWYYCDDQNIRPAEPTEVENNVYAYLLFYSSLPQPSIRLPVMSSN